MSDNNNNSSARSLGLFGGFFGPGGGRMREGWGGGQRIPVVNDSKLVDGVKNKYRAIFHATEILKTSYLYRSRFPMDGRVKFQR